MNKECKYFSDKDFGGNPAELCRLIPKTDNGYEWTMQNCADIKDCPYKKLARGIITQEQCDEEVARRQHMVVKM